MGDGEIKQRQYPVIDALLNPKIKQRPFLEEVLFEGRPPSGEGVCVYTSPWGGMGTHSASTGPPNLLFVCKPRPFSVTSMRGQRQGSENGFCLHRLHMVASTPLRKVTSISWDLETEGPMTLGRFSFKSQRWDHIFPLHPPQRPSRPPR